jgi:membrane protease YdiL (CAAX protease family)
LKDAARLLGYFAATILFAALIAPILFWAAQWFAAHGVFPGLATFNFEAFFRRALILGGLLFLWPFLRSVRIGGFQDLELISNPGWKQDVGIGFLISFLPVLLTGIVLIGLGNYTVRSHIAWGAIVSVIVTAIVVPLIEEMFFRGLLLGIFLRHTRPLTAALITSAFFAIVHFLKAPEQTNRRVDWASGFVSMAHSFDQFAAPMLVLAGWSTLFIIGVILAYARLRTRSLWLPIGLHAGWIFASGIYNRIAHREVTALPWLGKNLLVGLVPLGVCFVSWLTLEVFLRYARSRES